MPSSGSAAFVRPPIASSTSSSSASASASASAAAAPSSSSPQSHPRHGIGDVDDDDNGSSLSSSWQDARLSLSSSAMPLHAMSNGSARARARSLDRASQRQQEQHDNDDADPTRSSRGDTAVDHSHSTSRTHRRPGHVSPHPTATPPASTSASASASATSTSAPGPSSSSSSSSTTIGPAATSGGRLRDIADLRTKTCWVCYEDSSDTPGRDFVHACECTLVAHTDCLLAWVTTDQVNKRTPAKCPVCATPYVIVQDRSTLLALYNRLRRRWDSLSIILAGSGLVAGFGFVSAAWGAWAIKTFAGNQVARALLLRHERMPWRYWLNLPWIPLTLILARTPLIDSLLPFLPLTLVLSNHSSSYFLNSIQDPLGLDNLSLTYPPSPTLLLCALPWVRLVYLRLRRRVFRAVLGRRGHGFEGFAGVLADMQEGDADGGAHRNRNAGEEGEQGEDDQQDGGRRRQRRGVGAGGFEVVAEIQVEQIVVPAHQDVHVRGVPPPPGGGAAIVQNRLRVGLGRLTSLVVGALLFPAVCSTAGSALFWLASKGGARPTSGWIRILRKVLGVQLVLASRYGLSSGRPSRTSWLSTLFFPSSTSSPALSASNPIDPIWLRNAIGGAVVLVTRDVVELVVGLLEQKREKSRRIVGRPFGEGLVLDDLEDQRASSASGFGAASGGVDARTGREARVHTML
ncbi:BQ2448_7094 [Microbotryum intermedium]|uniref:BQ2448_7094 protein n=1 Tax=Microbotryum intermedium TaxID=269621 RepID=A0A238FK46_9BASI|nr:BQ2448_7094 [Microbotryum intermedium]